jgi:hypothetical protein
MVRWEGKYYNVDGTGNVKDPLLFLIVNSPIHTASARGSHDRLFSIPTTWMSDDKSTFLHPPMDLKVGGIHFWDWSLISLKKRRFPESSWTELQISDFLTEVDYPSKYYIVYY